MTNVTIIGFGTMGKAIAKALSKDSSIEIFAIDKNKKDVTGIKKSDFIILATKPQDATEAISELEKHGINEKTILISIMAGFPIQKIINISKHKKVIRMMPNLGLSIGNGIAVWKKENLDKDEYKKAKKFLDKISENFEVKDEDTINKTTAISGSGPAYFFFLANNLIKAGQKLGFTEKESQKLVQKTFNSAAILGNDLDYPSLIKKIASKKGTTEAALKIFKKRKLEKIILEAVIAAYQRAKQLSK